MKTRTPDVFASLQFCAGSKPCLSWSSPGAVRYPIHRGTRPSQPVLRDDFVDSCLRRQLPDDLPELETVLRKPFYATALGERVRSLLKERP